MVDGGGGGGKWHSAVAGGRESRAESVSSSITASTAAAATVTVSSFYLSRLESSAGRDGGREWCAVRSLGERESGKGKKEKAATFAPSLARSVGWLAGWSHGMLWYGS